jgi:hypothetical protein
MRSRAELQSRCVSLACVRSFEMIQPSDTWKVGLAILEAQESKTGAKDKARNRVHFCALEVSLSNNLHNVVRGKEHNTRRLLAVTFDPVTELNRRAQLRRGGKRLLA